MKIEWLVTDVTAAGSPDRTKRAILEVILTVFLPIQAAFVVGSYFVMLSGQCRVMFADRVLATYAT